MAKFDEEEYLKRIQREIAAEVAREQQAERDAKMDRALENEFAELFHMTPAEARKLLDDEVTNSKLTEAELEEAFRFVQTGKKKYRKSAKKANKAIADKKGCQLFGLAMLGSASISIWVIAEGLWMLFG